MFSLPPNAPFKGAQRKWLEGYLAGLSSLLPSSSPDSFQELAKPTGIPITIIWGSQTGSSESLAKQATKKLTAQGHVVTLKSMADVTLASLQLVSTLLIITSTYGDGEPPDNAASLYAELKQVQEPVLSGMRFSILALGDSSYPDFCQCGKDFNSFLNQAGAKSICDMIECDVEFDQPFQTWLAQLETLVS